MRCNGLIGGAAVLLVANGIIRTAKQLPEVSRTAVWGRAALCLAGASCDWLGGNIEKLIFEKMTHQTSNLTSFISSFA
ncbi:MAG: hypothetical protein K8R34_12100 [Methanosarcinales archaeon]|nr:hypothetical protein [Methanosarcinales archaeon]